MTVQVGTRSQIRVVARERRLGTIVRNAGVVVTNVSTGGAATVYSDEDLTTVITSLVTDGSGVFSFYAPPGTYSISFTGSDAFEAVENVHVVGDDTSPTGTYASAETAGDVAVAKTRMYLMPSPSGGDDTVALHAARDAAGAGARLVFPSMGTYVVDGLTASVASQHWQLPAGVTIRKAPTSTNRMLAMSAANVVVSGGIFDGNRINGATGEGIRVTAAGCVLQDLTSKSNKGPGVATSGAAASLTCKGVTSTDNAAGTASADGFIVSSSALLVTDDNCVATLNERAGFFVINGAAAHCHINGRTNRNQWGATILANDVRSHYFESIDDDQFGLTVGNGTVTPTRCRFGLVRADNTGVTAGNVSATGVELYGADHCTFDSVQARGSQGYGLALATAGGVATSQCRFGVVDVSNCSDPGVSIGNASKNTFGTILATDVLSVAVNIGESGNATDNMIGVIEATGCTYGAVRFTTAADNNHIGRVVARDCYTTDAAHPGVLDIEGTNNTVGYIGHRTTTGTKPLYVIWTSAGSSGNRVLDGRRDYTTADYQTAPVLDQGSNEISIGTAKLDDLTLWAGVTGAATAREYPPLVTALSDLSVLTSGVMQVTGIPLHIGDVVNYLTFISGTVGLTMGSNLDGHLWVSLYDSTATLVQQSSDQGGSFAWSSGSAKKIQLAAPVTVTKSGIYYAGIMVNFGTGGSPALPRLRGANLSSPQNGAFNSRKAQGGTNGTGLTTTAPTGPIAITAGLAPYVMATSA